MIQRTSKDLIFRHSGLSFTCLDLYCNCKHILCFFVIAYAKPFVDSLIIY